MASQAPPPAATPQDVSASAEPDVPTTPASAGPTVRERIGSYIPAWVKRITDTGLPQPPTFDDVYGSANGVFAENSFRPGFVASIATPISESLFFSNNFTFGSAEAQKYTFTAQYAEELTKGKDLVVLMGEVDHNGKLDGQLKYIINPALSVKLTSSFQNRNNAAGFIETEYKGSDWIGSVQMANIDIIQDHGVIVGQYCQSITKSLSAGIACENGIFGARKSFGVSMAHVSYKTDDVSACGLYLHNVALVNYTRTLKNNKAKVASQLSFDTMTGKTGLSVGYQYNFRSAQCRGSINQDGIVTGLVEKQLGPALRIGFGGMIGRTQTFGFNLRFG